MALWITGYVDAAAVDGAGLLPDFSPDPFLALDPFFSPDPELDPPSPDPELDAASLVEDPLTDVFDFLPSWRLSVR